MSLRAKMLATQLCTTRHSLAMLYSSWHNYHHVYSAIQYVYVCSYTIFVVMAKFLQLDLPYEQKRRHSGKVFVDGYTTTKTTEVSPLKALHMYMVIVTSFWETYFSANNQILWLFIPVALSHRPTKLIFVVNLVAS